MTYVAVVLAFTSMTALIEMARQRRKGHRLYESFEAAETELEEAWTRNTEIIASNASAMESRKEMIVENNERTEALRLMDLERGAFIEEMDGHLAELLRRQQKIDAYAVMHEEATAELMLHQTKIEAIKRILEPKQTWLDKKIAEEFEVPVAGWPPMMPEIITTEGCTPVMGTEEPIPAKERETPPPPTHSWE